MNTSSRSSLANTKTSVFVCALEIRSNKEGARVV